MRTKLLEQFSGLFVDPSDAAKNAALHLFLEIRQSLGEQEARRIFAMWGTPPSDSRINEIERMAIIDRLDFMVKTDKDGNHVRGEDGMLIFESNVKELARQIAGEKY